MRSLYNKLYDYERSWKAEFPCIDSRITFHSCKEGLIDPFVDLFKYFLPTPETHSQKEITCVIAQTTDIDGWPDCLFNDAQEILEIDDIALGEAAVVSYDCGMALIMKPFGSIFHSGDGHFICLTVPPEKELNEGEYPDVLGIATVLLSEILLLTNKLLVHGGAVGDGKSCQIWTGDSGAGKTTQILKLVAKGWQFYGEDQIIIGRNDDDQWMVCLSGDRYMLRKKPQSFFLHTRSSPVFLPMPGKNIILKILKKSFESKNLRPYLYPLFLRSSLDMEGYWRN